MSEIADVLAAIESLSAKGERMALATIVAIRGSTYRREGARLLVPAEGTGPVGTISGGCLEGEVCTGSGTGRDVGGTGRGWLHFDLTADDEAVWGWGLGCNGVIDVFVEPAERAVQMAGAIQRAIDDERELVAVTVIRAGDGVGRRARGAGPDRAGRHEPEGSLGDPTLDERAKSAARRGRCETEVFLDGRDLRRRRRGIRRGLGSADQAARVRGRARRDPARAVRCGTRMGASRVADDRACVPERRALPGGDGLRSDRTLRDVATAARVDRRTYAVVMTHNFMRDKDYLRSLLGSPAPGTSGCSGPEHERFDKLLAELRRRGVRTGGRMTSARVHSPAGLDVGAGRDRRRSRGRSPPRSSRSRAGETGRLPAGSTGSDPRPAEAGRRGPVVRPCGDRARARCRRATPPRRSGTRPTPLPAPT